MPRTSSLSLPCSSLGRKIALESDLEVEPLPLSTSLDMLLFPSFLVGLVLPSLVLAAGRADPSDKADKFRALARKNNGLVVLDSALYEELVDGPRDYSIGILLTAVAPQYSCGPCHIFAPELVMVAKQWSKQAERDEHIFAVLDFADGQAVYARLGLTQAPSYQLFKPTTGPRASSKVGAEPYDLSRGGYKAEPFAAFIAEMAGIPLKFSRPVDKTKLVVTGATIGGAIVFGITAWPLVRSILTNTYIWSSGTIFIILIMNAGYMWNQIRHPAYAQPMGNGRMNYVAQGYSNQLGAETHIVAVVYGLLAFSVYTLAFTIPKLTDPTRQRLGIYVWTGISVVMMGLLMQLFTMKQGGYPFRFF